MRCYDRTTQLHGCVSREQDRFVEGMTANGSILREFNKGRRRAQRAKGEET